MAVSGSSGAIYIIWNCHSQKQIIVRQARSTSMKSLQEIYRIMRDQKPQMLKDDSGKNIALNKRALCSN